MVTPGGAIIILYDPAVSLTQGVLANATVNITGSNTVGSFTIVNGRKWLYI